MIDTELKQSILGNPSIAWLFIKKLTPDEAYNQTSSFHKKWNYLFDRSALEQKIRTKHNKMGRYGEATKNQIQYEIGALEAELIQLKEIQSKKITDYESR